MGYKSILSDLKYDLVVKESEVEKLKSQIECIEKKRNTKIESGLIIKRVYDNYFGEVHNYFYINEVLKEFPILVKGNNIIKVGNKFEINSDALLDIYETMDFEFVDKEEYDKVLDECADSMNAIIDYSEKHSKEDFCGLEEK